MKRISWVHITTLTTIMVIVMGFFALSVKSDLAHTNKMLDSVAVDIKTIKMDQMVLQRQVDKNSVMQSVISKKLDEHMEETHK